MIGKNRQPPNTFVPSFRDEWQIKKSKYSPEERCAWGDFLHAADWQHGTFSISHLEMQKEYGWTKKKVECFFKRLMADGTIKMHQKSNSKNQQTIYIFTLFTVEDHKRKNENPIKSKGVVQGVDDKKYGVVQGVDNHTQDIDSKDAKKEVGGGSGGGSCESGGWIGDSHLYTKKEELKKPTTRRAEPEAAESGAAPENPEIAPAEPEQAGSAKHESEPDRIAEPGRTRETEREQPEYAKGMPESAARTPAGSVKPGREGNDTAALVIAAREPLKSAWSGKRYTEDSFRAAHDIHRLKMQWLWRCFFENPEFCVPKFDETGKMKGRRIPTFRESMCRPCEWECPSHGWVKGEEWRPEFFDFGDMGDDSKTFMKRDDSVVTPCSQCVSERQAAKEEKAGLDAATRKAHEHVTLKINRHVEVADTLLKTEGAKVAAHYIGENMIAEMGKFAGSGIVKQDFYEIERWLAAVSPRKIFGIIINSVERRNKSGGDPYQTWGYFTKSLLGEK